MISPFYPYKPFRTIKVVKTRKDHICEACAGLIKKGDYAFVVIERRHRLQKIPDVYYYHYNEEVTPKELLFMSHNEIRKRICGKIPYIWEVENEEKTGF